MSHGSVPAQTPENLHAPATRLQQIDGLRGVAMLFVFFGHFCAMWAQFPHAQGATAIFLRVVDADATIGSSFFMLLSAFFTYGSQMRAKRGFREFLRGRLCRIYPLYLIIVLIYVAGCLAIPSRSKLPADPGDAALYIIQTLLFLPGLLPIRPLIDVSWTLSFVILFYLIAGVLARIFRRWGCTRGQRLAFLSTMAVVWTLLSMLTSWFEPRTGMFWIGMALSEVIGAISGERLKWAIRLAKPAAVVTLVGIALRTWLMLTAPGTGPVPLMTWRFVITAITLSSFVWVAYFGPEWWKRLLSGPRLAMLGAASYSFYLTHGFAIKAFRFGVFPLAGDFLMTVPFFWASQIGGLALAIFIARVVYLRVEQPLAVWVSTLGWSRPARPSEAPVAHGLEQAARLLPTFREPRRT